MNIQIKIDKKIIGENNPAFIIAELSANHRHDLDLALKTVKAMKSAGADAVKIQTLTPDTMTINCRNEYFTIKSGTPWDGRTLYELYSETPLPWEWHDKIRGLAHDLGMVFFSTPYDPTSVDFLEKLGVPAYKIASFEITDIPLIEYAAAKGKPMLISTGMAELTDIEAAVRACQRMNNNDIILLKCTSAYPAPFDEANLRTVPHMSETFKTVVGVSDHTLGSTVSVAAVVLGAKVVEKHFILDRTLGGPDADFSMEPEEFGRMVKSIREAEQAVGEVSYTLSEKSRKNLIFMRSLFVVEDMKKGEIFTRKNVRSIRPGFGLHPRYLEEFMGKRAGRDISRGEPLSWGMLG